MYKKAIVSFIDILGFRKIVDTSTADDVKSILEEVHDFAKPKIDDDADYSFEPETITFSDSIVRVRKIERGLDFDHPLGFVHYELKDLLLAQVALINREVLIRGGVAYGDIYFDNNHVYGPALNQAYELEAFYAVYPRIVISPSVIEEVKRNYLLKDKERTHEEELEIVKEFVKQGDDGLWFIDYLSKAEEIVISPEEFLTYLLKHKKVICEGAKKFDEMSKELGKYLWMSKYHNEFVFRNLTEQKLAPYQIARKKLEISDKDLPMLQNIKSKE